MFSLAFISLPTVYLSTDIDLSVKFSSGQVWFQNRRAKWRKREKALGRESPTPPPPGIPGTDRAMNPFLLGAPGDIFTCGPFGTDPFWAPHSAGPLSGGPLGAWPKLYMLPALLPAPCSILDAGPISKRGQRSPGGSSSGSSPSSSSLDLLRIKAKEHAAKGRSKPTTSSSPVEKTEPS